MIFIGYYGIGKTTFCLTNNLLNTQRKFIDLNANYMTSDNPNIPYDPETLLDFYARTVLELANQKFHIFVPLEKPIIDKFIDRVKYMEINLIGKYETHIILPDISMIDKWKEHLTEIYLKDISEYNHISLFNTAKCYDKIMDYVNIVEKENNIHVYRFTLDKDISTTINERIFTYIRYQIDKGEDKPCLMTL